MTEFLCKTRGEHGLDHKGRVYFTCHPDDFARSFEKITEDILSAQNCAIYYTDDMTLVDEEMYTNASLGRMNLFVIPVSFQLLKGGCRAFARDLAYAKEKNIPVLPIMLETGIDEFYSRPEAFGERQYLSPDATDKTGVSYAEKLRKYLAAVLVDETLASRIRNAFDAYIFLSYRKKDRAYADTLMRLIHKNPECRDIAIWYDEFLTPGESFRKNIFKALDRSDLFALLVTPNLLEENNFVMREEYPAARSVGKPILPMEMVATDKDALRADYSGIPDPADPTANEDFRARLADALSHLVVLENDGDAEHNFLIGLAYLEGIDVEVDRERALSLITMAAEADLTEAMAKLCEMYGEGKGVAMDYHRAAFWAEKMATQCEEKYGEEHPSTLLALHNLATVRLALGDFGTALPLWERLYGLRVRVLGEAHADTLTTLNNFATACLQAGDRVRALPLFEKAYELSLNAFGEEHPNTLTALGNIAFTHVELGDYARALPLQEKVYEQSCRVLGEEHPNTLLALNNVAFTYNQMGDCARALPLQEKAYEQSCRVLGEEHPNTVLALSNVAFICTQSGDRDRAIPLQEQVYEMSCHVLGKEHPQTLLYLGNLAMNYAQGGDNARALPLQEEVYECGIRALGKEHPNVLLAANNLAHICSELGDCDRAVSLLEEALALSQSALGEQHPHTLTILNTLGHAYSNREEYERALPLFEKAYELNCRVFGEGNSQSILILNNLAQICSCLDENDRALSLLETAYENSCRALGEEHPMTLLAMSNLATCYCNEEEFERALPILEKAYEASRRLFGDHCPDTVALREALEEVREELEEEEEYEAPPPPSRSTSAPSSSMLALKEKAYEIRCRSLGEEHPAVMKMLEELALGYIEADELARAVGYLEKLYALRTRLLGENHPDTVDTREALEELREDLREELDEELDVEIVEEAPPSPKKEEIKPPPAALGMIPLKEKAYEIRCRSLGEEHPAVMKMLEELATAYADAGDYARAVELQEKLCTIRARVLGESHPDTVRSRERLAQLRAKLEGK